MQSVGHQRWLMLPSYWCHSLLVVICATSSYRASFGGLQLHFVSFFSKNGTYGIRTVYTKEKCWWTFPPSELAILSKASGQKSSEGSRMIDTPDMSLPIRHCRRWWEKTDAMTSDYSKCNLHLDVFPISLVVSLEQRFKATTRHWPMNKWWY